MWTNQSYYVRKVVVTMEILPGKDSVPSAGEKSTVKRDSAKYKKIGSLQNGNTQI